MYFFKKIIKIPHRCARLHFFTIFLVSCVSSRAGLIDVIHVYPPAGLVDDADVVYWINTTVKGITGKRAYQITESLKGYMHVSLMDNNKESEFTLIISNVGCSPDWFRVNDQRRLGFNRSGRLVKIDGVPWDIEYTHRYDADRRDTIITPFIFPTSEK